MAIVPNRAPVRPRVYDRRADSASSRLLEDEIHSLLESGVYGPVRIIGPKGSGKTTALCHLKSLFGSSEDVRFVEDPALTELLEDSREHLVVYASDQKLSPYHVAEYLLAPWSRDDCIEYLLALHADHCASVISRIEEAEAAGLEGLPDLWSIVLDELAWDPAIPSVDEALRHFIAGSLVERKSRRLAREIARVLLFSERAEETQVTAQEVLTREIARMSGVSDRFGMAMQQRKVQVLLAADGILRDLESGAECTWLGMSLPDDLTLAVAKRLREREEAKDRLAHLLTAGDSTRRMHPTCATLLFASDPTRLVALIKAHVGAGDALPAFTGAQLDGIVFSHFSLTELAADRAMLHYAELEHATLEKASLRRAVLDYARLGGATLTDVVLYGASMQHADCSGASATHCSLSEVDWTGASLAGSRFSKCSLQRANLHNADFSQVLFDESDLTHCDLRGARFTGARFPGSDLSGLDLRWATFDDADFSRADLHQCNLEGMHLENARFAGASLTGALLTDSCMHGGRFGGADLKGAGLAGIDWEGADLLGADLRGVSFHLGSTRTGTLFHRPPSEGTRTGYYTEDHEDKGFRAPEEIRKASLRGADLRGAQIADTDFYLVDLREVICTPDQRAHFEKCGAIL